MLITFQRLQDFINGTMVVEYVKHIDGHENSKGEKAPWCIVSHETGKVISSHKTKKEAEEHLKQMHMFKSK